MDAVRTEEERKMSYLSTVPLFKNASVNRNLTGKSDCCLAGQIENLIKQEMFEMLS